MTKFNLLFVVATKVEATVASVPSQFLDLFKPSVLLQLQHSSACCRYYSQHSYCTSAVDLVFAEGCATVPSKHQTTAEYQTALAVLLCFP